MLEQYCKAFKAYDIRGVYGKEIDEKFAYILWKTVGNYLMEHHERPSFLLASDVRSQNIALISHFLWGMQEMGDIAITVASLDSDASLGSKYPYGICSTPTLYYLAQYDFDLAVAVTASHNPGGYVGMKFADRNVELVSPAFLQQLFKNFYFEEAYVKSFPLFVAEESTIVQEKMEKLTAFLMDKRKRLSKRYKFVVDFSNGAGVTFEKQFFQQLSDRHDIIFINDFPDGTFAAHESDTSEDSNYHQLSQAILEHWADFWLMFDGDADRIGLMSNAGDRTKFIRGDMITAVIAKGLLSTPLSLQPLCPSDISPSRGEPSKEGEVFYDVMSTKVVEKIAKQYGGTARRTRTGRYFINKELNACGGLFAGEVSGHYMFREVGGYEMPLLAVFYVLEALEEYADFDTMMAAFPSSFKTPIVNLNVEDKERCLVAVKEVFKEYPQDFLDGVSVYGEDFWLNVRGSNTENKIRYTVEADSLEKMEEVEEKLKRLIGG